MSYREDREYLEEQKKIKAALKENAERLEIEESNRIREEIENAKLTHQAMFEHYHQYKDDVKKTLLTEALIRIYEGSIYHINDREKVICEALLSNYINETGTSALLRKMKFSESGILIDIQEKVNEYYQKITEKADPQDLSTQTINPEDVESFWKDIDKTNDVDDITNLIRLRVSDAEEQFVNKNHEDKEDVKTVLKDTSERVALAKKSNDNDYSEAVEESETRLAKQKIYSIQHEGYRSVFDRMVHTIAESAVKNPEARKNFVQENGRLDMDSIVESARCMYTLLEMVSTLMIEKVDEQYITDTINSIK